MISLLNPESLLAKAGIALILGIGCASGGYWLGLQPGRAEAAAAKLVCSQTLAKQESNALLLQQARDTAAQADLQKVMDDVKQSEAARATLADQNAKLAATNAKLSRSLDARGAQLLQLKSLIAGYAAGPPGATNPACAGVAGRAKVLGDVLSGGLGLAQESLGLLQRGLGLLGADEKLDSDLANDAEQLAVLLRGWQDRYHTVEPPPR